MKTEIGKTVQLPRPTPQIARSLSQQELQDHRQAIASEVKAVLSAYFQPHESEEIKAIQLAWWCDELQDWTREQVVWGLRTWNRQNPAIRPTPGHIVAILLAMRGKVEAERMAKNKRDLIDTNIGNSNSRRMTPERAAEIMAEVGVRVKTFPEVGDGAE